MLFFLLTGMKHIFAHDAVIHVVNTSDFQADTVTDTFKSPDKTLKIKVALSFPINKFPKKNISRN